VKKAVRSGPCVRELAGFSKLLENITLETGNSLKGNHEKVSVAARSGRGLQNQLRWRNSAPEPIRLGPARSGAVASMLGDVGGTRRRIARRAFAACGQIAKARGNSVCALVVSALAISLGSAAAQPPAVAVEGAEKVHARLAEDGKISVGTTKTDFKGLPKKLAALGVPVNTTILIAVPEETPQKTLKAIGRELASAGFKHFMFVKPRRTVSFTREDRSDESGVR